MRAYRATWCTVLAVVAVPALLAAGLTLGWLAILATSGMLAALGAVVGLGWADGPARWRFVCASAALFGLLDTLLLGLPTVLGGWAVLVILVLAATSPPVLGSVARAYWRWCPGEPTSRLGRVSNRDLERRWRRTSDELHRHSLAPADALRLVQEREVLLDEIDRRDQARFEQRLVSAGWHGAGSIVD